MELSDGDRRVSVDLYGRLRQDAPAGAGLGAITARLRLRQR